MTDYTSLSRAQWFELAGAYAEHLTHVIESLTPQEWEQRTQYMGWTARQLLAHMASAVPLNFMESLKRALADDPAPLHELDAFARNAIAVHARRIFTVPVLINEFKSTIASFLTTYRNLDDTDWLKPAWFFVGRVDVRAMLLLVLADVMLHERDLRIVKGDWPGFNADFTGPVVDWYMMELRPGSFRPEQAGDLRATIQYRLSGPAGGEWVLQIENGKCTSQRGSIPNPDVTIEAGAEDLFAAAQARTTPFFGTLARVFSGIRGPLHGEDVTALITGLISLGLAAKIQKRIRVTGNQAIANKANGCFWHFWERETQAEYNILHDPAFSQ
jgi:uncharacterized protein (TIGR03083 family)